MEWNKETIAAALIVVAGSNVSGVANIYSPNVRADAYTPLDAAYLEAKLLLRIKECRDEDEDSMDELRQRITSNETYIKFLWDGKAL